MAKARGGLLPPHPREIWERAREMGARGLGPTAISRALNIPRSTAHGFLRRGYRQVPRVEDQAAFAERAREMMAEGATQKAIAKAMGVTRATVYRICGPMGVHNRRPQLPPARVKRLVEMIRAGTMTADEIAEAVGCSSENVRRRRSEMARRGEISLPLDGNAAMRPQIVALRLQGQTQRAIAIALGLTSHVVRSQLDIAFRDNPGAKPKQDRRRIYESKEARMAAKRARKREAERARSAQRREAAKSLARETRKAGAAPMPPRIVTPHRLLVLPDSRIDRDTEQRAVEAAIQAGVGRRYEIMRTPPGRQVQTADDAVSLMRERGFAVEIKSSSEGRLRRYRVTGGSPFDDRWLLPHAFCTAVRTLAAQSTYRVVPLREAYSSHAGA